MSVKFYVKGLGLYHGGKDDMGNLPPLAEILPGVNLRRVSAVGRLALGSAARALGGSGLAVPLDENKAPKVGLYIGSSLGAAGSSFAFMDSILDGGAQLASPTHFSHSVNNVFCGFLSLHLNIQGPSCTVCQFGLSFAGAVQGALDALAAGAVDLALVGAVEECCPPMALARQRVQAAAPPPELDCAAFFLLSRESADAWAQIAPPEWECGPRPGDASPYRAHPAGQALDLAAALLSIKAGEIKSAAECRRTDEKRALGAVLKLFPAA